MGRQRNAAVNDCNSKKFAGVVDKEGHVLSNMSGNSVGVDGDTFKGAGGRVDLDKICGSKNQMCALDLNGALALDSQGMVQFTGKGTITTLDQLITANPDWRSPMGGWQGSIGKFAAFDYQPGSFWDRLAESYSGTHDTFNSPTWYDDLGNIKRGMSEGLQTIGNVTNYMNVLLATPFALSSMMPPGAYAALQADVKKRNAGGQ
jgi:filamentous hemagglutinin